MEGCCHGDLDKIYATIQQLEKKQNTKIDLLICCGDFQVSAFLQVLYLPMNPFCYPCVSTWRVSSRLCGTWTTSSAWPARQSTGT